MFDKDNHIFHLAARFVNQTSKPIFLTGKAGTGKTTFLQYIRDNSAKKMAVVAPTGVAAINAGGVTMHSFFQLPFGPYIPSGPSGWGLENSQVSNAHSLFKNIRFNSEKRALLQELELLIIDEVSMVRADTLDAVDAIMRHFRQKESLPFGGVQMLYIGDLFQLPPVVSQEEWQLLSPHYKSPFFFEALAVQQSPPVYLELKKIYRQHEAGFIHLLNQVRNNMASTEDLRQLQKHYRPEFIAPKNEHYITLTSHNAKADSINQKELGKLTHPSYAFDASITGEFNERSFPADKTLQLKEGAQVMFIKNDKGETRRYFNGKIGTIASISQDKIIIRCSADEVPVLLEKETWKNIRYLYNKEKDRIEEEELGTFTQYPLRLAWAITIHKSQGLTFQRAIIDAGSSFAPGQVYVALSRLRSLEGLVLYSRILPQSIKTDERVIAFTNSEMAADALERQLAGGQLHFVGERIMDCFGWSAVVEKLFQIYEERFQKEIPEIKQASTLIKNLYDRAKELQELSARFVRQLQLLIVLASDEGYGALKDRTDSASKYFIQALDLEYKMPLKKLTAELAIRPKAKKYVGLLLDLCRLLEDRLLAMERASAITNTLLQEGTQAALQISWIKQSRSQNDEDPARRNSLGKGLSKATKGSSQLTSFNLYKQGMTAKTIAEKRGMSQSTIEQHLSHYVATGEIPAEALVHASKIPAILAAIKKTNSTKPKTLKEYLGPQYSYSDIQVVLKSREWKGENTDK